MIKTAAIALVALILGAAVSYLATTQIIALRGGMGMAGLVQDIDTIKTNQQVIDMMACMPLAKAEGIKVDHLILNQTLNRQLASFDNGTSKAFNLLLFVKGYGIGQGELLLSQQKTSASLACQQRFPSIYLAKDL